MSNLLFGGELHKFPIYLMIPGLRKNETPDDYKGLRLYKDRDDWWWIYYSRLRMTGRFETKGMAIKWFQQKER